ncbi:MAG TPA: hypothetical protein VFW70_11365 [Methylomirabilota bacterium]|nr:hypothetical protein [Methylomirabilota bacterium]
MRKVTFSPGWMVTRHDAQRGSSAIDHPLFLRAIVSPGPTDSDDPPAGGGLQIMTREYVRKAEVERLLSPRVAATKTRIEAMPRAVAPECVRAAERGGPRAVEQVLHDYVRSMLTEIANMAQPL